MVTFPKDIGGLDTLDTGTITFDWRTLANLKSRLEGSYDEFILATFINVWRRPSAYSCNRMSYLCDTQFDANPLQALISADYLAVVAVFSSPPMKVSPMEVSPTGSFYYTG